jgi:hypothetical protein
MTIITQLGDDPAVAAADLLRGHIFQPPDHIAKAMPPLRSSTGGPGTVIRLHYYLRDRDWWLAELDPETGTAWGYVHTGNPLEAAWQLVKLPELAVATMGEGEAAVYVQRDRYWQVARFDQIPLARSILAVRAELQDRGDSW